MLGLSADKLLKKPALLTTPVVVVAVSNARRARGKPDGLPAVHAFVAVNLSITLDISGGPRVS